MILTERDLPGLIASGDKSRIHWAYNALDCSVTREVRDEMPALTPVQERIYRFEFQCQGPALTMSLRGVLIDPKRRAEAIEFHEKEMGRAEETAASLAGDHWNVTCSNSGRCGEHRNHNWPRGVEPAVAACRRCGVSRLRPKPFECGSHQQVAALLYDKLGVRPRKNRDGGITTDDKALDSIKAEYRKRATELKRPAGIAEAEIVVALVEQVQSFREHQKQVGYARSRVGVDGRMRSSFNVGATETGRWSASQAADRTGWNSQQISERLRGMVIADPGLELFYADLKSAESQVVAFDAEDQSYMDAHAAGDVHTQVVGLVWPERFAGDHLDKNAAEQPTDFDPHHSWRDYAKHVQHGGNIGQSPWGMARDARIPLAHAEEVYRRMYEEAFPRVRARQRDIRATVQRERKLTTPLGRERQFLGRTWDDSTQREALAYTQQGTVADVLNLALYRMWAELDTRANVCDAPHPNQPNRVWLLAQVHDAVLGLRRAADDDALRRVRELMTIPILIRGRLCIIPVEIMVGPSWSKKEMRVWTG